MLIRFVKFGQFNGMNHENNFCNILFFMLKKDKISFTFFHEGRGPGGGTETLQGNYHVIERFGLFSRSTSIIQTQPEE